MYKWKKKRFRGSLMLLLGGLAVLIIVKNLMTMNTGQSLARRMKDLACDKLAYALVKIQAPVLTWQVEEKEDSLFAWIEQSLLEGMPLYTYCREKQQTETAPESAITFEMIQASSGVAAGELSEETPGTVEEKKTEEVGSKKQEGEDCEDSLVAYSGDFRKDILKVFSGKKLKDYEYLISHFYHVDSTTQLPQSQLKFGKLFEKDLTIEKEGKEPKILIYHTHSQEGYKASSKSKGKTVVDVGDYLTKLLEEEYHIPVLHHTGEYDVKSRDTAYSTALPHIEKILEENPSIEVVIDLHRDGVNEKTRLVTQINGKKMAQIMFFNGVSRSKALGALDYLENKNLSENLAFSLQMQLAARAYYPSLTRDIYIKGYRYNMHLKGKTLLVEVGAQTNTYEEAKNAMEPLAKLLDRVLNE
ncbi:MAG: stage II sporulation protein P [Lachnospiraceae bacterium]